jgi:hypothetical protein
LRQGAGHATLSFTSRLGALLVPWTFVAIFGTLYVWLLLPRALEGHLLTVCVAIFSAYVFAVFTIAAITF